MNVLKIILGDEAVAKFSPNEVAALAHELDAGILEDEAFTGRLSKSSLTLLDVKR